MKLLLFIFFILISLPNTTQANEMLWQNFVFADGNLDGKLDYDEFKLFADFNSIDGIEKFKKLKNLSDRYDAFIEIDSSADGFLSRAELRKALNEPSLQISVTKPS